MKRNSFACILLTYFFVFVVSLSFNSRSLFAQNAGSSHDTQASAAAYSECVKKGNTQLRQGDENGCHNMSVAISTFNCIINNPQISENVKSEARQGLSKVENDYRTKCGTGSSGSNTPVVSQPAFDNTQLLQQVQEISIAQQQNIEMSYIRQQEMQGNFQDVLNNAFQYSTSDHAETVKTASDIANDLKRVEEEKVKNFSRKKFMEITKWLLESHVSPKTDRLSFQIAGATSKQTGVTRWWGVSLDMIREDIVKVLEVELFEYLQNSIVPSQLDPPAFFVTNSDVELQDSIRIFGRTDKKTGQIFWEYSYNDYWKVGKPTSVEEDIWGKYFFQLIPEEEMERSLKYLNNFFW